MVWSPEALRELSEEERTGSDFPLLTTGATVWLSERVERDRSEQEQVLVAAGVKRWWRHPAAAGVVLGCLNSTTRVSSSEVSIS